MNLKAKRVIHITIIVYMLLSITIVPGMTQTALATGAGTFRTTGDVNVRSEPSTDASVVTILYTNTNVEVLEHDPAGWSKVTTGGKTGFIRSDLLRFPIGNTPATFRTTDGVNLRASASIEARIVTTVLAGTSVDVLEHNPAGWSRVRIDSNNGFIRSDFLTRSFGASNPGSSGTSSSSDQAIATLKTIGSVNLRSEPSTSSNIIRTLPTGTSVEVVENRTDGWSSVRHNGTAGFITSELLTGSSSSSGQAGATLRTIGSVNLRASASTSATIIRTLPLGASVDIVENRSDGWSSVKHNGTAGFIKTDLLTASVGQDNSTLRTIGSVNLRAGASTSSSIIRTLPQGTSVDIVDNRTDGWSSVRHNGTAGFIKTDLLTSSTSPNQVIATLRTIGGVNLRAGPSTSTRVIRLLPAGTRVSVFANEANGWSRVSHDGTSGYIKSDLLGPDANVELIDWSVAINIVPLRTNIRVVDVRTGISFNLRPFSKSGHADVEPPTRADTDAILRTRNGVWAWAPRPVWVTIGNRTFAGALNGMPHDVSTIRDNGMNGHLCLHFNNTVTISKTYQRDLNNAVMEAFNRRPQ